VAEHALSTGRLFLSHHLDRPLFAQIGNRSVLNKQNSYDRTMPKDPPIELTDIATIGSAFASLSVNKVFGWMRLLSRLKPWEAASVRTYRFGGKNDERTLLNPQEVVANG